jgi:hypothetical protein
MHKLSLTVILITCMVMLSAAAGGACTQPKPLTGSALELRSLRTDR